MVDGTAPPRGPERPQLRCRDARRANQRRAERLAGNEYLGAVGRQSVDPRLAEHEHLGLRDLAGRGVHGGEAPPLERVHGEEVAAEVDGVAEGEQCAHEVVATEEGRADGRRPAA